MRTIQPPHWTGYQPAPDAPMVCGACPHWKFCVALDRCERATDGLATWSKEVVERFDAFRRNRGSVEETRLGEAVNQLRNLSR